MGKDQNEGFKIAVHRLRARGRKKMPRGYRKDPKEYEETTLDGN